MEEELLKEPDNTIHENKENIDILWKKLYSIKWIKKNKLTNDQESYKLESDSKDNAPESF